MTEIHKFSLREMVYDTTYLVDCLLFLESIDYIFTFQNDNINLKTDFIKMFDKCINTYEDEPGFYNKEFLIRKFELPTWKNELIKFTHLQKLAYTILEVFDINLLHSLKITSAKNPLYKLHSKNGRNGKKRKEIVVRDSKGRRISVNRQNAIRRVSMDTNGKRTSIIKYNELPYILIQPLSDIVVKPKYRCFIFCKKGLDTYCNAYLDITKLFDTEISDLTKYKLLNMSNDEICSIFVKYGKV
jgi:hypothetical protein